jgi:hypothetical protein
MSTIYVSPTGSASAAGTAAAPTTLGRARTLARAGDIIIARPGEYRDVADPNRPDRMIILPAGVTLRSETPLAAKLLPRAFVYAIVELSSNCSCEGFEMGSPRSQGHHHGVWANGVHHVQAIGNKCYNGRESGIGMMKVDHVLIDGNECYGNSWWSWGSGISIYEPEAKPLNAGEAEPAFRIVVRNNVSHDNVREVSGDGSQYTDGNGIIMDDFIHWQNDPKVAYPHRSLVENNLVYANGGKGIAIHWCNGITTRRNTSVGNNLDNKNTATWRGELSQQDGERNIWQANLGVADRAPNANNTGIGYYGNLGSGNQWIGNATNDARPNLGGASGSLPGSGNLFNVAPILVDFVPTNAILANIGWRPSGVVPTPLPDPEPVPEPEPEPAAPDELSPFALGEPESILDPASVVAERVPYELGTKFRADRAGRITALRAYRTNTTDQAMRLWKGGAVVATGALPGGPNGWAEVAVDFPAAAGDEFVVSISKTASQRYAADNALAEEVAGDGFTIPVRGGVYATSVGALPTQVYETSYYWIDVRFADAATEEPEEPSEDMEEITAALAALTARVAVIEGVPADYGPRIILLQEQMATVQAAQADLNARMTALEGAGSPDLSGVQEELARLDARLDAISGAAGD